MLLLPPKLSVAYAYPDATHKSITSPEYDNKNKETEEGWLVRDVFNTGRRYWFRKHKGYLFDEVLWNKFKDRVNWIELIHLDCPKWVVKDISFKDADKFKIEVKTRLNKAFVIPEIYWNSYQMGEPTFK